MNNLLRLYREWGYRTTRAGGVTGLSHLQGDRSIVVEIMFSLDTIASDAVDRSVAAIDLLISDARLRKTLGYSEDLSESQVNEDCAYMF